MDRLQRFVEEAMGLIQEASSDPENPSVEIRNGLGGSSPYELDGEELVSLIALVLTDGLHHGLTAWDVLEQIDRLPETAQVCLAPSTAATSGRSLHAVPADVDDLMSVPELETYMSFMSRDRSAVPNSGDDGNVPTATATRRAMHGLSTKFLRNIASMAKKFSPSAPAPVRAKVFLRCALNMRSLTAAIEALASQPMIGKTFYGPNGLFRSPLAVKTLLTIIAPIGGPNLRVRAAASLFDVGQDVLVKPGLDYDGLSALIQSSGATRAAENASRSTTATSETADAVALLCSTVAEARDTLRQYPVAAAYLSVATVRFKLELTLKSDQQLLGAAASPGGPGSDPYGGARRRGASVMVPGGGGGEADNALAAADETSSSNPIVVQRRRRAGTVRAANGAPIPAAKRSVKRKPGTGSEVTSPAAAGERVSSPQALSPQHSGDIIGVDAPSIGEPAVHPSGPFPPRAGGRGDSASGSQSYPQQPPPRPQPPQATRRSQSPAALQPSPSTSGMLANPSTTFNASLASTLRGGKSASPVMAAPRATTLSEHLATTNIRELVSFTDDELAAMDAAKARALELDARVAKLKEFVHRRDERMSQHSANVEPLLAAYEESVARMFEAALVRMAGKERELMAFHDYDAPPPPPDDDEEDDEPSIVAPPVSRTHVYGKLSSH